MYPYTPFTSESLTSVGTEISSTVQAVDDISSLTGAVASITGKQVIFFTVGMVALVASLTLIIAALSEQAVTSPAGKAVTKAVALI